MERELSTGDFSAYFRAVHGREPFPWQVRLLREVVESGWPSLCDLPPASGKTAALDIAVFSLALDALNTPRRVPIRTVFTVDRRLVVDDAHARALLIANKLSEALGSTPLEGDGRVLAEVARRLTSLGGHDNERPPLQVAVLRGGLPRDNGWIESVHQPTLVVSTVDQVGSRILFRGYGVSPGMAPVHAGLLGEDTLHILDEAHLSLPFAETLGAISILRGKASDPVGLPFARVTMTATPEEAAPHVFRLDMERDGADRAGAPVLDRRFAAVKLARMGTAPPRDVGHQAKAFASYAKECLREPQARVIGIIVNRVRLARKIHELLATEFGEAAVDPAVGGSVLLTGRCRPFERDMLLGIGQEQDPASPFARVIDRIRTGRIRSAQAEHQPLFVVGTQAIEAGADIDFDALVTEIAPWSSLRQRFGRLDRAGIIGATSAWIVRTHDPQEKEPGNADPVYGASGWNTCCFLWSLCRGHATDKEPPNKAVDMGTDGLLALGEVPPGLIPAAMHAPCLTPSIMDLFAQTSPLPVPDPDPALWLHGPSSGPADVQIVWRADAPVGDDEASWEAFTDILTLVAPTSLEALPLPFRSARAWLSNLPADSADLEAVDTGGEDEERRKDNQKNGSKGFKQRDDVEGPGVPSVFVWRGGERSALVQPDDVRPGDTIILPSSRGGCDRFGWIPEAAVEPAPVRDFARETVERARERIVVRVHPKLLDEADWKQAEQVLKDLDEDASIAEAITSIKSSLPLVMAGIGPGAACARYDAMLPNYDDQRLPVRASGMAFVSQSRRRAGSRIQVLSDLLDDDDRAMLALGRVMLPAHCAGVGREVESACRAVGVRQELQEDMTMSGDTHDVGKAEPRFKAMLWNTDLIAALARPALAKSVAVKGSRKDRSEAFGRVTLPVGIRHECWSVVMLDGSHLLLAAHDPSLVLWLIGSHHGHGRPFFEPVDDTKPVIAEIVLDFLYGGTLFRLRGPVRHGLADAASGWPDRFDVLLARYGYWGLPWMEAVVRLSDARRSRIEEIMADEPDQVRAERGVA